MEELPLPTFSFTHPTLGGIIGRLATNVNGHDVIHFRSVPYATIPARFKQSILLSQLPKHFDNRAKGNFTQYGAACPQIGGSSDAWSDSYGGKLPDEHGIQFNEFTCLTLSISVPKFALLGQQVRPLPVMVYVHGGGLSDGVGHVDGLHETTKMVAFSCEEDLPVIMVNVGYRLNWLGFLACQDLIDEAREEGESGDVFNLGLYDQRRAFQWVQAQISGFGGDPAKITAFGESAGSISLVYHLCSDVPLFQRVILQSGGLFGTMTMEEKNAVYFKLLGELRVHGNTTNERLDSLRNVPVETLVRSGAAGPHLLPFVDGQQMFPRGIPNYSNQFQLVRECSWIEALVIGDDHFEGHVFLDFTKGSDARKFVKVANAAFGEDRAAPLLRAYDIAADTDANLLWSNVAMLMGDLFLSEPMHTLANKLAESKALQPGRTSGVKVYRYHFCLSNPFPGSSCYSVVGHHYVEILFLFLTLLHRYPSRRNRFLEIQARELARRWISFACGKEPWDEYIPSSVGGEGKIAVCDDREGWSTRTRVDDGDISQEDPWGRRRYGELELLHSTFNQLEVERDQAEGGPANMARKMILNTLSFKI